MKTKCHFKFVTDRKWKKTWNLGNKKFKYEEKNIQQEKYWIILENCINTVSQSVNDAGKTKYKNKNEKVKVWS